MATIVAGGPSRATVLSPRSPLPQRPPPSYTVRRIADRSTCLRRSRHGHIGNCPPVCRLHCRSEMETPMSRPVRNRLLGACAASLMLAACGSSSPTSPTTGNSGGGATIAGTVHERGHTERVDVVSERRSAAPARRLVRDSTDDRFVGAGCRHQPLHRRRLGRSVSDLRRASGQRQAPVHRRRRERDDNAHRRGEQPVRRDSSANQRHIGGDRGRLAGGQGDDVPRRRQRLVSRDQHQRERRGVAPGARRWKDRRSGPWAVRAAIRRELSRRRPGGRHRPDNTASR